MATPKLSVTSTRARALIGVAIGLAVGGVVALTRETDAVSGLETRLVDARTLAYLDSRPPDPDIVLSVIENADLGVVKNEWGERWPWPLDVNAYAFDWLAECHPKCVVIDLYQFDQGRGPEEKGLPAPIEGQERDTDANYHAATRDAGLAEDLADEYRRIETVVMAIELTNQPPEAGSQDHEFRLPLAEAVFARMPPMNRRAVLPLPLINLPVAKLIPAARALGFANAVQDPDSIARRTYPVRGWGKRPLPSLPLAAALAATGGEVFESEIRCGDAVQRLSADGSFLVALRGPARSYAMVHPSDILKAAQELAAWREQGRQGEPPSHGSARPEAVRGKIVIWGLNAAGVKDVISVPGGDRLSGFAGFPGAEFQATVIDNLLHGDGRIEAPRAVNLVILLALAAVVGLVTGVVSRRRGAAILTVLLAGGGLWLGAYRAFAHGTSVDLFSPSAAIVLTFAAVSGFRTLTEGRRNKWLEGTFSQYLSPAVIESLKKDPTMLRLGGRSCPLTILFSDIKGFTTISEKLNESDLVALLNDYLTRQSACVLEQDGVIDKFIGDAVMAFFGDPVAHADHAVRACRAAVRSIDAVEETQPLAESLGVAPISNRIGLASGPAVVGNIGSDRRFNYTCIGDTVNFASRLEGANKAFGSRILLSETTRNAAAAAILAKPLARLVVVGKNEPVAVFELIGMANEAPAALHAHTEAFTHAQAAVLADDLDAAERHLTTAEESRPKDGPCAWLRRLVGELRSGKRPRPWDGLWVLESK